MFHLGDCLRAGACYLDDKFINLAGRPLTHYRAVVVGPNHSNPRWGETPTRLRGLYELPPVDSHHFGIDACDEMEIELGYPSTVRMLGGLPGEADLFVDCCNDKWVVIHRRRKDDLLRGQNRLVLTVRRYQESTTSAKS